MTRVLITGVTGTLGTVLTQKMLDLGYEVIGISRDEQKQRLIKPHKNLTLRLADVRYYSSLKRVVNKKHIDKIYHLAALKCVDTLESNPEESLLTNVIGTRNMLDLADFTDSTLVFTSTDKACYPINAYGHSKALAEKLVMARGHMVCRYGNVIGSRGSFVPVLKQSLIRHKKAYVTHEDMTRFWMSIEDASNFVYQSSLSPKGDNLRIPHGIMACRITDIVAAIANLYDVKKYETEIIGIRPGEKLHETMRTAEETAYGFPTHSNNKSLQFTPESLSQFLAISLRGEST